MHGRGFAADIQKNVLIADTEEMVHEQQSARTTGIAGVVLSRKYRHGHCGLCSYLLTVDLEMEILPGFSVANWEMGFGDFRIVLDMSTLRMLPWHANTAIVVGDAFREDGTPVEEVLRSVLGRQASRLWERGFKACLGSELEFYLFNESYREARDKGYRQLIPSSEYNIDYHLLQPGRDEEVIRQIRNQMTAAGIPVECSKGETGRGQHEINLSYAEAMEMADRHVVYKAGAKGIASQHGKSITFMAKPWEDDAGSSCHVHSSLWDADGKRNLFYDPAERGPSMLFRQFLGGLLKYSRELSYFYAPTINSYKRYQAGSWAPTAIVWGHENRTCGFRVVGEGRSLRIENRMPGSDANPYLAFAAEIAAGLRGIEEKLDCCKVFEGNAYEAADLPRFPTSLEEASELLKGSEVAREAFGDQVVDFYVKTARFEVQSFKRAVTDWERERYFEQI